MAQPNVVALTTSWRTESFLSTGKPDYMGGVLEKYPEEKNELANLISMVYDSAPQTAIMGNRSTRTVTTRSRLIEPVTMDEVGGLASVAAATPFTFAYTQNSTTTAAPFLTNVQVGLELLNPIHGTIAKITVVTINALNDVTITALVTGARRFVPAGQTLPQGTSLMPMGVSVAEVSDSIQATSRDFDVYTWYLKEMRNSLPFSGRKAASGLIWVAPDKAAGSMDPSGLYLNMEIIDFSRQMRQEESRQLAFADPDFTQFNAINPGWGGNTLAAGIFPVMLGLTAYPGSFNQITGGFLALPLLDAVTRYNNSIDSACSEYCMLYDYEFSTKWSALIRSLNGVFQMWESSGYKERNGKGLDMDFTFLTYSDTKYWGKQLKIFSGGAGLNQTGSIYRDVAFGLPIKHVYDYYNGEKAPIVQRFFAKGAGDYQRLRNMWAWGNPHLFPVVEGGRKPGDGYPMASSGLDSVSFENQSESGTIFRGLDMGSFVFKAA